LPRDLIVDARKDAAVSKLVAKSLLRRAVDDSEHLGAAVTVL
jgi:hypothetical protein